MHMLAAQNNVIIVNLRYIAKSVSKLDSTGHSHICQSRILLFTEYLMWEGTERITANPAEIYININNTIMAQYVA